MKLSKAKFNKRFGQDIIVKLRDKETDEEKLVKFHSPDLERKPMNFLGSTNFKDPMEALIRRISTINSLGLACSNCGSSLNIEMHHVRHIKTINLKLNPFEKLMAEINRKQVPLCRTCHNLVHKGEYQGLSLSKYGKA